MVERQLRARGIDGRAGAARRWPRCRASCSCPRSSAGTPTTTARCDRRGPDDLPALDRGLHDAALELTGDETRARGGHGLAATAPRSCPAAAASVVTIERHASLAARRAELLRDARLHERRGAHGRRQSGRAGPRAVRRRSPYRHGRRRPPPRRFVAQLAPGGVLVCPVPRRRERLMRFHATADSARRSCRSASCR